MQSTEQLEKGLSTAQVQQLQKKYGHNLTLYPKKHWYQLLLRQIASPFIYLLCIAAIIAYSVNDTQTACIIMIIICINTTLSFFQEYRAERALRVLNTYISLKVEVLRDGKQQTIPSTELVPGDIIYLKPQSLVPADVRLIKAEGLLVDESALSGESAPVAKDIQGKNEQKECYLGTIITAGTAQAIIIATGIKTRFGAINTLILQKKQESHFAVTMKSLSRLFFMLTIISACLVIVAHLIIHGTQNFETTLLFAIALALSMTPEALPVVITVALSQSAALLAKRHVLVKRLSAIEDLGDITVLCTDKTGTLTQNKLVYTDHYQYNNAYDLLEIASLGDPENPSIFEQAIQNKRDKQKSQYTVLRTFPFEAQTRTQSLIIQDTKTNTQYMLTKGALESLAPANTKDMTKLISWETEKGALGQRVIAYAIKGEIIGLISFEDPLKDTTKEALATAKNLGIRVKIISGDSKVVSGAIAHQIGLIESPDHVITGAELAQLSTEEQEKALRTYDVFARITPEQKYTIVETYKKTDVVGYLGDGINDAPALKNAHVGIVVQEATDLAKSIADIILLKKDLGVIINGIALGRATFANTIKYVKITLAGNTGNVLTLSTVSFILPYLPLLPLQVLLVNLLCDIPMIAISTDTVDPHDLRRPCSYTNTDILRTTLLFAVISSLTDSIFFLIFHTLPAASVQTYWFIDNMVTEMLFILSLRTKKLFFKKPHPSKLIAILLLCTAFIGIALPFTRLGQHFFAFVKPHTHDVVIILLLACAYFIFTESIKLLYYRLVKRANNHSKTSAKRG